MRREAQTDDIRQFNRFYTRQTGLLNEHVLNSPFSLTEARIMFELANRKDTTASELEGELGLDPAQISRILRDFQNRGLLHKQRSKKDGRQSLLNLTKQGREEFGKLNALSNKQISAMLKRMTSQEQRDLTAAMQRIQGILSAKKDDKSYILRTPEAGDLGWVVQKNGEIYSDEYGWNEEYEGLVAEIVGQFVKNFDPKRERCWIAEKDGENIGCVFLVKKNGAVARLRLLLVDPKARGLGIGRRLVNECTRFARKAGYKKIELWTNSVLTAARHIYEKEGYKLVKEEPHRSFGHDLVGETWELALSQQQV